MENDREREQRLMDLSKHVGDLMRGHKPLDVVMVCFGAMSNALMRMNSQAERESLIPALENFIDGLQRERRH